MMQNRSYVFDLNLLQLPDATKIIIYAVLTLHYHIP